MSETSDQCELCSNQSNRVFPCLYHCKKMLCIQHLSEHEKYIEKQMEFKKQLENLWKNYLEIFNEENILREFEKLKAKIDYYKELKKQVHNLLFINHFHDSIDNNHIFENTIQLIQNAIQQEKQLNQNLDENTNLKIEIAPDDNDEEEKEQEEQQQQNIDYCKEIV